jgi:hypothetical protein
MNEQNNIQDKWVVDVKGDPNGECWEISVLKESNEHGKSSFGWFDENKLLISHNGGPCSWPLAPGIGQLMIELAHKYADYLNNKNTLEIDITIKLSENNNE